MNWYKKSSKTLQISEENRQKIKEFIPELQNSVIDMNHNIRRYGVYAKDEAYLHMGEKLVKTLTFERPYPMWFANEVEDADMYDSANVDVYIVYEKETKAEGWFIALDNVMEKLSIEYPDRYQWLNPLDEGDGTWYPSLWDNNTDKEDYVNARIYINTSWSYRDSKKIGIERDLRLYNNLYELMVHEVIHLFDPKTAHNSYKPSYREPSEPGQTNEEFGWNYFGSEPEFDAHTTHIIERTRMEIRSLPDNNSKLKRIEEISNTLRLGAFLPKAFRKWEKSPTYTRRFNQRIYNMIQEEASTINTA